MDYLPEAVANSGGSALSPFAECIVLAALYGRCMNHRRLVHAAVASGISSGSTWKRLEWLSAILDKRSQRLTQTSPVGVSLVERDPMLAFAHMLTHTSIIHLYHTAQAVPFKLGDNLWQPMALTYEQRAHHSASYIARLAEAVPRLDYFKVSDLVPSRCFLPILYLLYCLLQYMSFSRVDESIPEVRRVDTASTYLLAIFHTGPSIFSQRTIQCYDVFNDSRQTSWVLKSISGDQPRSRAASQRVAKPERCQPPSSRSTTHSRGWSMGPV